MTLWKLLIVATALALAACNARAADLPVLGEVPRFALTDQNGKSFNERTLRGKPWAAAFVFTRCPTACPRVTRAMREIQSATERRKVRLDLVSFSIDPEFDTPEVLRKYAAEYAADLRSWYFVTGDASGIQATAERGFKIAAEGKADPSKPDFGISHGTQLALVDGGGRIRGYYATSEPEALVRLVDDAERLRGGEAR